MQTGVCRQHYSINNRLISFVSAFCQAGEKVDLNMNLCVNCTRGEYHPESFATRDPAEQASCISCAAGMTTIYPGSENQTQCVSKYTRLKNVGKWDNIFQSGKVYEI